MDLEIATAAVRSIVNQAELVSVLSLVVIGGVLALFIQMRTHISIGGNDEIHPRNIWLMWISIILATLSATLSYAVSGMLAEMSPQIFSVEFDVSKGFSHQDFGPAPMSQLQIISGIQFLAFLLSIIVGACFVARNT